MQIDSVYKGRKWDDTVLGEVWFIPVPEKLSQILENDTDLFFKKPITDIIQKSVLSNIEISERQTEEGFLGVTYSYDDFYYAINAKNEITITGRNLFSSSFLDIPSTIEGKIVTTIGKAAFKDSSLKSITIPNSVTTIEEFAFGNCNSLKSITIPDSVTTIEGFVFYDCDSLTSITIPDSVISIGVDAFDDCESITIQCNPGSYAEKYCKDNNLKCFIISD